MKVIDFTTGTPAGYMRRFDDVIARLGADDAAPARKTDLMGEAMNCILGLKVLQTKEPDASWTKDDLPAFWLRAAESLRRNRVALAGFIARMDTALWERTDEGWYQACLRRSALEVLRQDVQGTVVIVEPATLAETDDEMRDIATVVPPLADDAIPDGIPTGHWWWTLPSGTADNTAEY